MITKDNYIEIMQDVNFDVAPKTLREGHEYVMRTTELISNWEDYDEVPAIKEAIDLYFEKLQKYIDEGKPGENKPATVATKEKTTSKKEKKFKEIIIEPEQAAAEIKKTTPSKPKKTTKKKAQVIEDELEKIQVEILPVEIKVLKRYAGLDNKKVERKKALDLLNYLQKAILERKISKDSAYADVIMKVQRELITMLDKMKGAANIVIDPKTKEAYVKTIKQFETYQSVALLKRYVSMHGKPDIRDKALTLIVTIERAIEKNKVSKMDKYYAPLRKALLHLKELEKGKASVLEIDEQELNGIGVLLPGLNGLLTDDNELDGCGCQPTPEMPLNGKITGAELAKMKFTLLPVTGEWKEFLGDIEPGFIMLISGMQGQGKSSLAMSLAGYFAQKIGPVLYLTSEMQASAKLQSLAQRAGGESPNIDYMYSLPADLSGYSFVFVDSLTTSGLNWDGWLEVFKKYPKKSFIVILRSNKDGSYKGSSNIQYDGDISINCFMGTATTIKNRYGGLDEMKIPGYKTKK